MRTRLPLLAVTATIALLALAPAAQAATPFTAGTGAGQDLAVGSDGTAHVVWVTEEADNRIGYCRIPAGGTACDSESTFLDFPGAASDSPSPHAQVFTPADNKVVILASCHTCPDLPTRTFRYISLNNGVSFPSAGTEVGNLQLNGQASWYETSGVALSVSGRVFQGQSTPASSSTLTLGSTVSSVYDASTAMSGGPGEKAVYAVNDLHAVEYRVFTNPAPPGVTAAELNNITYWSAPKALSTPEGNNDETHLGWGPSGFYLTYRYGQPTENRIGLRRFDTATNTFGAPSYIEGDDPIENNGIGESFHSQDAMGRLHVVWRSLFDGNRLRYRRSDDGGATFTPAATLATRETFLSPMVEAGPAGTGFAAWRSGSNIRVVAIDPQPEPPAPPGGGGPGGGPGPDTTAPSAGSFTMGDPTLLPGQGTSFSFNSSEAGLAVLTVQKQVPGLRMRIRGRMRCVPQTRRRLRALRRQAGSDAAFRRLVRRRRCTAYKKIGSIRQTVTPGRNTINFSGRIAGRRLRPGRYRALLVITDSAGNKSRVERIRFRVLRPRRG
jgi:hypothetical protein